MENICWEYLPLYPADFQLWASKRAHTQSHTLIHKGVHMYLLCLPRVHTHPAISGCPIVATNFSDIGFSLNQKLLRESFFSNPSFWVVYAWQREPLSTAWADRDEDKADDDDDECFDFIMWNSCMYVCVSVCRKYMWSSRAKLVVLVQVLRFVHNILLYYHFRNVLDFARKAHKVDFFHHKKKEFVETYKGYFRK